MRKMILAAALALAFVSPAAAGGHCTSYRSGSYTKTFCSGSYRGHHWTRNATSYRSGSYRKTYWH